MASEDFTLGMSDNVPGGSPCVPIKTRYQEHNSSNKGHDKVAVEYFSDNGMLRYEWPVFYCPAVAKPTADETSSRGGTIINRDSRIKEANPYSKYEEVDGIHCEINQLTFPRIRDALPFGQFENTACVATVARALTNLFDRLGFKPFPLPTHFVHPSRLTIPFVCNRGVFLAQMAKVDRAGACPVRVYGLKFFNTLLADVHVNPLHSMIYLCGGSYGMSEEQVMGGFSFIQGTRANQLPMPLRQLVSADSYGLHSTIPNTNGKAKNLAYACDYYKWAEQMCVLDKTGQLARTTMQQAHPEEQPISEAYWSQEVLSFDVPVSVSCARSYSHMQKAARDASTGRHSVSVARANYPNRSHAMTGANIEVSMPMAAFTSVSDVAGRVVNSFSAVLDAKNRGDRINNG